MHSPANAQLASGYERVVVIAPTATGNKVIASPRSQAALLEAEGARVEVITPDAGTRKAIGRNPWIPPGEPRRPGRPRPVRGPHRGGRRGVERLTRPGGRPEPVTMGE